MKKGILLALVLVAVIVAGFGIVKWRDYVVRHQDTLNYRHGCELVRDGKFAEAAALVRARTPYQRPSPEVACQWRELEVDIAVHLHQWAQLLAIYERWPEAVVRNEDASLMAARAFLHSHREDRFEQIASVWRDRSTRSHLWFALDVDALLVEGKKEEALASLRSHSFAGAADCGRLSRLALLSGDDLQAAWNYLADAAALDPHNTDVRSFRAQILEGIGKFQLARVEYVAAHLAEPTNLLLRDQLAEFYKRRGNYAGAVEVWAGDAVEPVFDFMWVKSWFWSRVAHPAKIASSRGDELTALVKCLRATPDDAFWSESESAHISNVKGFGQQQQEIFWLRLFEQLRTHRESDADELLRGERPRGTSWNPDLETALLRIISYRTAGVLNPHGQPVVALSRPAAELHPFIVQLDEMAKAERENRLVMPADLDHLLHGGNAFAAAILTAGWTEAALRLRSGDEVSDRDPAWIAYGFAQALRFNRGNRPALEFLQKQNSTPELSGLTGELLLADGHVEEGLAKLRELATADSDVGFRAAWLLSLAALDQKKSADAAEIIQAQPRLASSTTGREILARIAIAEGRVADAEKLFESLASESAEAKSYLARRAFAQKNWSEARRYTDELMQIFPDEMQLRANLEAIQRAERAGS